MRISDWSSDVCSSDLPGAGARPGPAGGAGPPRRTARARRPVRAPAQDAVPGARRRMSRRTRAPRHWFEGPDPWPERLLSKVYGGAIALRLRLFELHLLRRVSINRPVIVVGNLIAGGSGKTPLAIVLVERLRAAGFNPGVATRGYGRDDAGTPRWEIGRAHV